MAINQSSYFVIGFFIKYREDREDRAFNRLLTLKIKIWPFKPIFKWYIKETYLCLPRHTCVYTYIYMYIQKGLVFNKGNDEN